MSAGAATMFFILRVRGISAIRYCKDEFHRSRTEIRLVMPKIYSVTMFFIVREQEPGKSASATMFFIVARRGQPKPTQQAFI
jgi:hypothetical protein